MRVEGRPYTMFGAGNDATDLAFKSFLDALKKYPNHRGRFVGSPNGGYIPETEYRAAKTGRKAEPHRWSNPELEVAACKLQIAKAKAGLL